MPQDANLPQTGLPEAGELSPVKRALIEIRRLRAELEESKRGQSEPIAIVGMAMRFPGGVTSPERFWQALAEGEDLIGAVPPERWDVREFLNADPDHVGTMYDGHGGFLSDIDSFDAEFFGINPREAASMDPQQRILLELTWEALERAAIPPKSLFHTSAGVFLGMTNCDYARETMGDARNVDAYAGVGACMSIAAGRISYFLGTHGPAVVVDTACSSSLAALHQAVRSLRDGEIDLAIVGAANLILSPEFNVGFSRTRMLSRDGHCKTFDATADGYVRSEGCGVVVLRRLADAKREGDPVLAWVAGTAMNQDGRSAGITAPNGPAQEAVIRAALADARVSAAAVSFVEAHGTGTPLGDPMEVRSLAAVYAENRSNEDRLKIGAVKTNLGHTEAAAGMAGLMKVVLMMQHGHGIVPNLHFKEPNPKIDWAGLPIEVPTKLTPWSVSDERLYAGLSSFGFSGTNTHVIVASPDRSEGTKDTADGAELLLVLSAANEDALRELAGRYVAFVRKGNDRFIDVCFTAMTGRNIFEHRIAARARDAMAAAEMLEQWLDGKPAEGLVASGDVQSIARAATDKLGMRQSQYARGEMLQWQDVTEAAAKRIVLPVYPFRRTRYWFGLTPLEKQQREKEDTWRAAQNAAESQSLQGPLGWKVDGYPERWEVLHRLTMAHARNVLSELKAFEAHRGLSVDEVMQRCGFLPLYRNLIARWLKGLADDGVLLEKGGLFQPAGDFSSIDLDLNWRDAGRCLAESPGVLAYLQRCSELLRDVLTGKASALETLFPQGSFELAAGIYETTAEARYLNPIVAAAVQGVARSIGKRRNARVLEIGGGTGGTTSAVLPHLSANEIEYWFTDLSEMFLHRARRKFTAFPFMRYAIFDLDAVLDGQGFGESQFDVVVAANVVHAARDLKAALAKIQYLLADGGVAVLLESTQHYSWFDMTTGLIEGWQHFEDELRGKHPLLHPEQWKELFEQNGFSHVVTLPRADSGAAAIGQHVIVARCAKEHKDPAFADGTTNIAVERKPQTLTEYGDADPEFALSLRTLPKQERDAAVFDFVCETIQRVFNLPQAADEFTERDRLSDLGMDSLIALELRAELAKGTRLGERLSSTIAFDTGTVGELTKALIRAMDEERSLSEDGSANLHPSELRRVQGTEKAEKIEIVSNTALLTVDELDAMSEEDVEQLLKERLTRR